MLSLLKSKKLLFKGVFALFLIIGCQAPTLLFAADELPKSGDIINFSINALDGTAQQAKVITKPETAPTFAAILGELINLLLGLLGLVFFILIIYGGIIWMTAGGDKTKADKAVKILSRSTLGILIVILAYLLANFIIFKLIGIVTFV